jgi:hypothetical protein
MSIELARNMYVPLGQSVDDLDTGPRIGGRSPDIPLKGLDDTMKYLATIPANRGNEISLFVSIDSDRWFPSTGLLLPVEAQSPLAVILHPFSTRRKDDAYRSELESRRLELGPPQPDILLCDLNGPQVPESPYGGNKIGGEPLLVNYEEENFGRYHELVTQGIRQIVQFDVFYLECEPGNGYLHVFGDGKTIGPPFYWLWEF